MKRRAFLTGAAAFAAITGTARAQTGPGGEHATGQTYVLVHGAWGGGWIWRSVAEGLRGRGHRVITPTQTGTGERTHLLSRQITVETHVNDVAQVLEAEELSDLILVGHSYGGMAATGVADRMPERIRRLVYFDALVPENGDTAFSLLPPGMAETRMKSVREQGGGVALPVPPPEAFPMPNGPVKDWFLRHLRPHPVGTYDSPIRLAKPAGAGLPVTYVSFTNPALASIEPSRQRARSKTGWKVMELPVPHDAPVIEPQRVIDLLASLR